MFSVLWICTPSLLAKAWSRAVFPKEGDRGEGHPEVEGKYRRSGSDDPSATAEGDQFLAILLTTQNGRRARTGRIFVDPEMLPKTRQETIHGSLGS